MRTTSAPHVDAQRTEANQVRTKPIAEPSPTPVAPPAEIDANRGDYGAGASSAQNAARTQQMGGPAQASAGAMGVNRWALAAKLERGAPRAQAKLQTLSDLTQSMKFLASAAVGDGDTAIGAALSEAAKERLDEQAGQLEGALAGDFAEPLHASELSNLAESARTLRAAAQKLGSRVRADEAAQLQEQIPANAIHHEPCAGDDARNTAKELVSLATSHRRPAVANFDGTLMIAKPGAPADAVFKRWEASSSTRSDDERLAQRLEALAYKLEWRLHTETARSRIADLANLPPRSLDAVLTSLKSMTREQNGAYASYLMAGMCELEHPGEIEAFARHYVDVMPSLSEGSRTPEEARAVAINNMRLWINARGGAATGTDAFWNAAIEMVDPRD